VNVPQYREPQHMDWRMIIEIIGIARATSRNNKKCDGRCVSRICLYY